MNRAGHRSPRPAGVLGEQLAKVRSSSRASGNRWLELLPVHRVGRDAAAPAIRYAPGCPRGGRDGTPQRSVHGLHITITSRPTAAHKDVAKITSRDTEGSTEEDR
jgi:hypothetical protein